MKRSVFICLIVILLLGAWLRLDRLGEVPPSLYGDEASVGYDAWSIAVHGKDQWGNTMPIAFKSFGEYKNPIHIYATSLAIKRLGYTDFVVRLPSAITGIANLLLLFILARLILRNEWVALTSAGLLSISPWHIQFSRIAWETNFALGIFLLAMIAFFYGIRGRSWLIVVALALFGIDLYTYNAAKVFVPLFLLLIGTIYHDVLFKQFRFVLIGVIAFFAATILSLAKPELSGLTRYQQVQLPTAAIDESHLYRLTGVRSLGQIDAVVQHYLQHYSLRFLFESGDPNPRHSIQRVGETYWFDLVLLPIGLLTLLYRRRSTDFILLGWFLLAPLPGAITSEAPHAGRAMYALGGWQMVSATGLAAAWRFVAHKRRNYFGCIVLTTGLSTAITASVLMYVDNYFNIYPIEHSVSWQYGFKKLFTDYRNEFDRYDNVFVSDHNRAYQGPYMHALHYLKYDSEKYRSSVVRSTENPLEVVQFDKIRFHAFDLKNPPNGNSLIFAAPEEDLALKAIRRGIVRNKDGSIAFVVYEYSN